MERHSNVYVVTVRNSQVSFSVEEERVSIVNQPKWMAAAVGAHLLMLFHVHLPGHMSSPECLNRACTSLTRFPIMQELRISHSLSVPRLFIPDLRTRVSCTHHIRFCWFVGKLSPSPRLNSPSFHPDTCVSISLRIHYPSSHPEVVVVTNHLACYMHLTFARWRHLVCYMCSWPWSLLYDVLLIPMTWVCYSAV